MNVLPLRGTPCAVCGHPASHTEINADCRTIHHRRDGKGARCELPNIPPTPAEDTPIRGPYRTRTGLQPCGTPAAYKRHLRHGEVTCDPCKRAVWKDQKRRAAA